MTAKLLVDSVSRVFPGRGGGPDVTALQPTNLAVAENDFGTNASCGPA